MTDPLRAVLGARHNRVLAALPLSSRDLDSDALFDPTEPGPSWYRLTVALHETWSGYRASPHDDALIDLLWGQWALFLWYRMQTDLLEERYRDLRLQFVADRFLLDGLASLERVPGLGPAFHLDCRARLRECTGGVLEVERLQAVPGAFTAAHLPLHGRVAAVQRIGPAAVCHRLRHTADLEWIGELQAQIAISASITRELEELHVDVESGRYTFVANVLAGALPGEALSARELNRRLADGLMRPGADRPIWQSLSRAARVAADALPGHAPALAHQLASSLKSGPGGLAQQLQEVRVRALYGVHGHPYPA